MNKRITAIALALFTLSAAGFLAKRRFIGAGTLAATPYSSLSAMAKWPLPNSQTSILRRGVTHTLAKSADGTVIDFFDFDFARNPQLRFEIFDQDEDDAKPFDNHVSYWDRNVARATKQLNATNRGPVVAAWNGAFFGYNNRSSEEDAFHVSPVVLRGKAHFNTANHRWAFGVKHLAQGPKWQVFFKPSRAVLEREFDFAAGSVQCLVKDGKPLQVEPFPLRGGQFKKQPVPSNAQQAGHIPYFDHMRTCRASLAWSRDGRHLYLLTVKEPDSEAASSAALSMSVRGLQLPGGMSLAGGWTVADVQKFWLSKAVWCAVNSDAGDVLQLVYRHPKGNYTFVPPRQETGAMRLECDPKWNGAVEGGGSMMYFLVRESLSSQKLKGKKHAAKTK